MRKIFLHIMVSLDGYIDGRDGEMDWHFVDDGFEEYINHMLSSVKTTKWIINHDSN